MRTSEAAAPRPVWTRNILKQARRLCGEECIGCELADEAEFLTSLRGLLTNDSLTTEGKDRINSAFRLYRIGFDIKNAETKFTE